MDDLLKLIWDTWQTRIKPLIDNDPDELQRRLARRRSGLMRRPPRAWCLAVRASDRRINPATAICVPEDAAYPPSTRGYELEVYREHEVTLDARLVRELVRPIFIPKPGLDQAELAKMIGWAPQQLHEAARRGAFRVHHVRGLGGKFGRPVPVLYTDRPVDPSARRCKHADVLWGTTWKYLAERVPDELNQTLVRLPVVQDFGFAPPTSRGSRRRSGAEGARFLGWAWRCPGCRRTCRTVYYPLPPVYGLKLLDRDVRPPHPGDENDVDARPGPMQTFACKACHDVQYFARFNRDNWNVLITHLTGGMMYGRDVPRPAWYVQQRTRAFAPLPNRPPSRRRAQVLACILRGLRCAQIARELLISQSTVATHASTLYRQHNVKGPAALRAKLAAEQIASHEPASEQNHVQLPLGECAESS